MAEIDAAVGWYKHASVVQGRSLSISNRLTGKPAKGNGHLAGSFPMSLITQGGNLPSQAEIRVLYRPNTGDPGDGILVGTTTCNADGTWQVSDLNENLKFDIVARIPGFNDVLISNVQPVSASPSS